MKVYFSHGKESGPWGTKIRFLADIAEEMGCQVESIDYSATQDPEERVALLKETLPADEPEIILVGSSMGGYVSLVAALEYDVKGVFLLAPAVYMSLRVCPIALEVQDSVNQGTPQVRYSTTFN